jgi:hypothetical protein
MHSVNVCAAYCCATYRAICSVEQELLPGGRRVVLLATPNALYMTLGGPGLQSVFTK